MERTFVMIKPDGVQRGLVGECISRLERCGLKLLAVKTVKPTPEMVEKHYPASDEKWLRLMGDKTLSFYKEHGLDVVKNFKSNDNLEIGRMILRYLCEYISSGPVVLTVWTGPHAIEQVRKIVGNTYPALAAPGTIRGDLSVDSTYQAATSNRCVRNLVHASGDKNEAENEIALWFKKSELMQYPRCDEKVMFG
ncbi:MAG: nucleoside-diphosphate kinase [Candidatus Micrarchaeota archaeon]